MLRSDSEQHYVTSLNRSIMEVAQEKQRFDCLRSSTASAMRPTSASDQTSDTKRIACNLHKSTEVQSIIDKIVGSRKAKKRPPSTSFSRRGSIYSKLQKLSKQQKKELSLSLVYMLSSSEVTAKKALRHYMRSQQRKRGSKSRKARDRFQ